MITATDDSGNSASQTVTFNVNDIVETSVVFDTTSGQSTDVDGRIFDADTSYNIYVLMDSDASAPVMTETWSGADNLGADDRLVFIGDEGDIHNALGNGTDVASVISSGVSELFEINGETAFTFGDNGEFARVTGSGSESTDLWSGDSNLPALTVDTATLDQLPDWVTPLS